MNKLNNKKRKESNRFSPYSILAIAIVIVGTLAVKNEGFLLNTSGAATLPKDVYVSETGRDTNDGTFQHPFRTLTKAVQLAEAGQLLQVNLMPGPKDYSFTVSASENQDIQIGPGTMILVKPAVQVIEPLHYFPLEQEKGSAYWSVTTQGSFEIQKIDFARVGFVLQAQGKNAKVQILQSRFSEVDEGGLYDLVAIQGTASVYSSEIALPVRTAAGKFVALHTTADNGGVVNVGSSTFIYPPVDQLGPATQLVGVNLSALDGRFKGLGNKFTTIGFVPGQAPSDREFGFTVWQKRSKTNNLKFFNDFKVFQGTPVLVFE